MRLAYVSETYPPEVNGVALTVRRAVEDLRAHGHAVQLIRPRQRGEDALDGLDEWRTPGLPIPLYPDLRMGLALASSLRRRFEATRPQLVHVATQGPLGRAAVLAARQLGLPVSADFRTNFHRYSRYYRLGFAESAICRYLRGFHNRADCSFVPTQALREELSAQGFERLEVMPRGVDADFFSPARRSAALRGQWGVDASLPDDRQPVMLYVGRLAAEKNVGLALRAFDAARRLRPQLRMVVVGDGPLRARLEREFPAAIFAGVQRDEALATYYASADVFLFPSLSETFGNVTLEALASGLAVVSFAAAAAAEHIRHGDSGLLVAPGDEDGFVRSACRAAERDNRVLREQAREQACHADWNAVLRRFDLRLRQLAAGRAPEELRDAVLA